MRSKELSRRRFLHGSLGGAVVSLALPRLSPLLDNQGRAWAATGSRPVRYITWGFSNGVVPDKWNPQGSGAGSAWQLSPALQPLAPWKSYLSIVGNLKAEGTSQHGCGNTFVVTGAKATSSRDPLAISIDQIIAAETKKVTPLKSLEIGIVNAPEDEEPGRMAWSHNGANSSNFPTYDVGELFDRLFGANGPRAATGAPATSDASGGLALRRARKSVLDFVMEDAKRLRSALPGADRTRLDQHLEGVFALEKRISLAENPAPTAGSCKGPAVVNRMVGGGKFDAQAAAVNGAMSQLVALAFACDLTRVASFVVSQAGSKAQIPDFGVSGWHELSHEPDKEATIQKVVVRHVEYLATLVKTLHETPDGDGNLLDNVAIMTVNDCTDGWNHSGNDMPTAIIGKAGGKLRGDVYHRGTADFTSVAGLTVGRAVIGLPSFGVGSYKRTEPLAALTV